MSLHLTRASSQYAEVAAAINYNAAYTAYTWFRTTTTASSQLVFGISQSGTAFDAIFFLSGTGLMVRVQDAGGSADAGPTSISAATDYFAAMVRTDASTMNLYLGTTPANVALVGGTASRDETARTSATTTSLGRVLGSVNYLDGDVYGSGVASFAMSLAQLKDQAAYGTPTGTRWGAWRLDTVSDLGDYSGNGRNLTITNGPASNGAGFSSVQPSRRSPSLLVLM